jgi:uncharacterized protein
MSALNLFPPVYFNVMAKPAGSRCNLNCIYCYYQGKENLYRTGFVSEMSDSVLEKYTREYIQSQQVQNITFVWQGGEPALAGLDFYKKAVLLQHKYAGGKRIFNAFQTNGTLLTDEWCRFLADQGFLVGISIDGPREIHNRYRKFKTGTPSFDQVLKGIDRLRKYAVEFNTLTTVNRFNQDYPIDLYRFLKQIGSRYIQFLPVAEKTARSDGRPLNLSDNEPGNIATWSVEPLTYGDFLVAVFNDWVRNDVSRIFVQLFDATLANWVGANPCVCIYKEQCGDALVIEHNGDVYSCDHFVFKEFRLGNILESSFLELLYCQPQKQFGTNKSNSLPEQCRRCKWLFACNGECPKNRLSQSSGQKAGNNYLCEGFKRFFSHAEPYMQFMAQQIEKKQAPAKVMEWAKVGYCTN